MQDCTSSSSTVRVPFRFHNIDTTLKSDGETELIADNYENKTSSRGKEPMKPKSMKKYHKKPNKNGTHSWTFTENTVMESEESLHNDNDNETSISNTRSHSSIQYNHQHSHSTNKFIELVRKIKPGVQLSAITELNLCKQNIMRLDNMNIHLPSLKKLILSENQLANITDMPTGLIYLDLLKNRIEVIDLKNLKSLQKLDLSNNFIEDFSSLIELEGLRYLNASFNKIKSMKEFARMKNILWLSLQGNEIEEISFYKYKSYCLKYLDMSHNRIKCIGGLESLIYLNELILDHNSIMCIALEQPITRLSKLILNDNRITMFDATLFPQLTSLCLDDNSVRSIIGLNNLELLDSFSLRNQSCEKTEINIQHLRQIKGLYLSNCQFGRLDSFVDFYSLQHLELCSIGIEKLTPGMTQAMPNISTLNLNHNNLRNIHLIRNFKHLQALSLVGNKIVNLPNLTDTLSGCRQLKHIDLRKNPINAVYYSSKVVETDLFGTKSVSQLFQDLTWGKYDSQYLETLDSTWQERRMIYRALIIKSCPNMIMLDRLPVRSGERDQSHLIIADYVSLFSQL